MTKKDNFIKKLLIIVHCGVIIYEYTNGIAMPKFKKG